MVRTVLALMHGMVVTVIL